MKLEPLLYVSDLSQSIRFYTELLGFKLGELYPNKEQATYAPIYIGENKLMLVGTREDNKKFCKSGLGGSGVQFFIQTENVDVIYQSLLSKVKIVDEIENKSWGDREFTIEDPDGYLISFYTSTVK